jgi:hypothetical protein
MNQVGRIKITVGQPAIFKVKIVKAQAMGVDRIHPHGIDRAHGRTMAALQ